MVSLFLFMRGGGTLDAGTIWTIIIIIVLALLFGVVIINTTDWNWFD